MIDLDPQASAGNWADRRALKEAPAVVSAHVPRLLTRFSHSAGGCPVGWWLGGRPLAWARLHGVVNGVVWTHGVIALFSAIGSGLGDLRFLGRDAQAAAFRSMA